MLPLFLLAVLLGFGIYLRTAGLGRGEFGVDELYQVFAAEAISRGEGPRMPSGSLYTRGLDVTHLVRAATDALGTSEYSARIPSAAFGVLSLLLFAAVLWSVAGPWAAVIGTALFAVYPEAVHQSRSLRFYTYQLALGIGALYTGWRAVRSGVGTEVSSGRLLRQWGWFVATGVFLLLAARAQIVTLSVVVGWGAFVLGAAALDLYAHRQGALRSSAPVQASVAVLLLAIAALLFQAELVEDLLVRARSVPYWVISVEGGTTPLAYYYGLAATYPLLLALAPLIFLAAILRRPRLGVFLTLWFLIPLALHSFFLPWKGARFILIPMLGLFGASAIAGEWGATLLHRYLCARIRESATGLARFGSAAAAGVIGIIALTVFITLPAFHTARRIPGTVETTQWTSSADLLRMHPEVAALPWGHTRPLHPLYYWGRVDFLVSRARLAQVTGREADGSWRVHEREEGSPDRTTAVPVFTSAAALREHFASAGGVVIGLEPAAFARGLLDDDLVQVLQEEAQELCDGRCGRLRVYVWRFDGSSGLSEPPSPRQNASS